MQLSASLLLLGVLTVFRTLPVLSGVNRFFITLLRWLAYLLTIGLVASAVLSLVGGRHTRRVFARKSTVVGLLLIGLCLLVESQLIAGHLRVGVLAEILVMQSHVVGHLITLGLLLMSMLLTFRFT